MGGAGSWRCEVVLCREGGARRNNGGGGAEVDQQGADQRKNVGGGAAARELAATAAAGKGRGGLGGEGGQTVKSRMNTAMPSRSAAVSFNPSSTSGWSGRPSGSPAPPPGMQGRKVDRQIPATPPASAASPVPPFILRTWAEACPWMARIRFAFVSALSPGET